MLLSLHIENIAVIKNIDIDFDNGFNALTGETGAGKSVIIDAINILLGGKIDRELIRHGENRACVDGIFGETDSTVLSALSSLGISPDEEGHILICRSFTSDGHSSIKVNGQSVNITALREICANLITVHGQNDSLALTSKTAHTEILDRYAKNENLLAEYSALYAQMLKARRELADFRKEKDEKDELVDILKYQIAEIEAVKPKIGEEEILEDRCKKLINVEKITKHTSFVYRALKGGEKANAIYILDRCISSLETLSDTIGEASALAEELSDIKYRIDDISERTNAFADGIDGNPTELIDKVQNRLASIAKIKKKYGPETEDVIRNLEEKKNRLVKLENYEEREADLRSDIDEIGRKLTQCAKLLHDRRILAGKELEKQVCESLAFLDMPRVTFVCDISRLTHDGSPSFDKYGYDSVNFLISANSGQAPLPLDKIASGGELARIMLSLKSVLADSYGIGTVIYDEIDAGVSGKTARKIGLKLKMSAEKSQVICITHSAQIASLADAHLLIFKEDSGTETATHVKRLDNEGRIDELSRILGGINVTDAQRMAAIDMLVWDNDCDNF